MIRLTTILFLSLFVFSCGLPKDLRRLKRGSKKLEKLVAKYPELKRDTIIRDTVPVYIVEYVHDTVFSLETDTIWNDAGIKIIKTYPPNHFEYEKEGVKVSLDRVGHEYKLTVESKADTIYVPFEVGVPVIQPAKVVKADFSKWQTFKMTSGLIFWILIILFLVLIALKIFGRITIPFMK